MSVLRTMIFMKIVELLVLEFQISNVNVSPQNETASIVVQDNDTQPVISIRRKSNSDCTNN